MLDSSYVYIAAFFVASLVIAGSGVAYLTHKEPGQKLFYRDLAMVFAIAFLFPAIIFTFKRDLSPWWLVLSALLLGVSFKGLIAALFWKSVPLTRIQLVNAQTAPSSALKVVHLSDLHLCAADTTLEGGLPREQVIDASRKALAWADSQAPDLIVVTGDVTDTGTNDEWQIFETLLSELKEESRNKIIFIPGNHDLTIKQRHYDSGHDGDALLDYDTRCMAFVRAYFTHMPPKAKLLAPNGNDVNVMALLGHLRRPLDAYMAFPPRVQNVGETMHRMTTIISDGIRDLEQKELPWRPALRTFTPGIVFPEELRATFDDSESWPTSKCPLMVDLLQLLYPLIVFENDRNVVIALNSNTAASTWLADGALGKLGELQIKRLETILAKRAQDKLVIVLVHHHIGCPLEIKPQIAKHNIELKALQLHEGPLLAKTLRAHGAPTVLMHGHKHVGYAAKAGGITVLSGASVPYGNRLGGANCNLFLIDEQGDVALGASATITCS